MLFVDLPPELLQTILLHSSTPSFVQFIRTCRTLFDLAAQSRDVVQHHLNSVPGEKLSISSGLTSTQKLFLIFRRRAAASLLGVNVTADRRDFYSLLAPIDVSASSITATNPHNVALVRKGCTFIQVCEAFQGKLKLRGVLHARSDDRTEYKPIQTAFDQMNNVYVLYSIATKVTSIDQSKVYIKPPTGASLTRAGLSALSRPHDSWDISNMVGRNPVKDAKSVRPVGMSAYGGNKVSIVWDSGFFINHVKYMSIALHTLFQGDRLSTFVV
jgi:hypothetical protein